MIDDKVKIRCTKCSHVFRERAQKVRPGFQTNCPHCNRLITFDPTIEDRNVRKALSGAKEIRTAIEASRRAAAIAQEGAPVPVMDRSQY
jgi:predicted  nucleic acid-binding Zn-ribbon protein